MKHSLKSLVAIAAFAGLSLAAQAQPAVKILVVDMAKLYDNHYKTLEYNAKIQTDDQKAQEEVDKMNKAGQAVVDEYKALIEQTNNPALSADAKTKAQNDAQKKYEDIQRKQQEVQQFIGQTQQSLRQRLQTFRSVMLEEISKAATDIAKRKGATLLLDKAGPSLIGISNVVYSDTGFDITEEVMKDLNKDKPAGSPSAPAPAAPGATTPAAPGSITVPGLTPKKQ
ncbi:MAG TPA: OmpH family outer membrane protein [Opitutaceae bacterium]|nr:OmpH family outer membrane protein [Opitutaceae bacterium]